MYFTDDSVLPENQAPLIINAAPYGPEWMPGDKDYPDEIPVTLKAQVQRAVDCFNAGATQLHIHVRNPETGKLSTDIDQFNELLAALKHAVPKMILSVGGSINFVPKGKAADKDSWTGSYDTRHMLAELTPKPEQVTICVGTTQMDLAQMFTQDDVLGTSLENPKVAGAWVGLWADAGPAFYVEHLKRLRAAGIQPYFMLAHVHQLEIVERLIRRGLYMGPLNHNLTAIGGGACGRNPYDWLHYAQRSPHGSVLTFHNNMRGLIPMSLVAIALGFHCRCGIEDNIWRKPGERFTTIQQIEQLVRIAKEVGREVATPEDARAIMKIGTWYNSPDETLLALGLPPNRKDSQIGFIGYGKDAEGLHRFGVHAADAHPMAYCAMPPGAQGAKPGI
jgi:uncharacterized protein (DUF849 family)